ncbi:granulocyte-macrophage colony-stimulating factor receptor subunit alpha-like [Gastrophryne carolinensis]
MPNIMCAIDFTHVALVPPVADDDIYSIPFSLSENAYFNFTNLKVNLYPGFFNMTWDCNITSAMEQYEYAFILQEGPEEPVDISKCFFDHHIPREREFSIHHGLHIKILVEDGSGLVMMKELTVQQEGKPNTSAENLSCFIYNVTIMNCSWTVGKDAPKDVQYSLLLRHNDLTDTCEDYIVDSIGRQIGCSLIPQNIDFSDDVYFQVVGYSNEASIQFLDGHFKPNDYVILDPPRNISVTYNSNELEVTWKPPETKSDFSNQAFVYSINISGVIKDNKSGMSYIISDLKLHKKLIISLRARFADHLPNRSWSRWSEPQTIDLGSGTSPENHYYLLVIGIVPAALLLVLIVLCYRLKVWKRLFPQVPQPAIKLFDQTEQKLLLAKDKYAKVTQQLIALQNICSIGNEIEQRHLPNQLSPR